VAASDPPSGPRTVREILTGVLSRLGLERDLDDYRIWEAWDELVGPAVARNAQPVRLDARRLVVAVKNNMWMQELGLLRTNLVERINEWMGRQVVSEIFLVVGQIGEPAVPRRPAPRRNAAGSRAARDRSVRTTAAEQGAAADDEARPGRGRPGEPDADAVAAATQARITEALDSLWETARRRARSDDESS